MQRSESNTPRASSLTIVFFGTAFVLQAVTWWRGFHWYPLLPDPFPTHFDGAGVPDDWTPKSAAAWFMLPGISLVLFVGLAGVGMCLTWLARSAPELMNVPSKQRFVALPPAARAAVLGPTRAYLAWTAMLMCGLFFLILEGTGRVATGSMAALPIWPVFVVVGLMLGALLPYYRATVRTIDNAATNADLAARGGDPR